MLEAPTQLSQQNVRPELQTTAQNVSVSMIAERKEGSSKVLAAGDSWLSAKVQPNKADSCSKMKRGTGPMNKETLTDEDATRSSSEGKWSISSRNNEGSRPTAPLSRKRR